MSLAKSDIASESCLVLAKIATSFNDISSKVRVFHGQTTIKQPTLSISSHASKA